MRLRAPASGILFLCLAASADAQTTSSPSWKHNLTLYFVGAGMSGDVGIRRTTTELELGFGDILENLQFGFMGAYRVQRNAWSLGTDVVYMGLGASGEGGRAEVDVDQWVVEVNGGYELRPFATLLVGGRYNSLSNRLFFPVSVTEFKGTQDWVDPLIGARLSWKLGAEWAAHLRGDVGGFGVGSEFTWQVFPILEWKASDRLSASVGYRFLGIDYENEDDGFLYDMVISGPGLGLTAHF
jgi:hypothetical protein